MQLFDAASLSDRALGQILSFLRGGGVIAFPTDTAYGLGADPFNEGAVRRIFEMKGRAETKPILEFYSKDRVTNIDATQSPIKVLSEIISRVIELPEYQERSKHVS